MSPSDPVATLLGDLDRPAAPRAEFVEELRGRLQRELEAPPTRAFVTTRLLTRRPRLRLALVAVALFIVLAGIAAATYLLVHGAGHGPRDGSLTFFEMQKQASGPGRSAAIVAIGPDGTRRTVWRCPHDRFCGEPTSVAWSPDGLRLAITLVEYGARSPYPAFHIVDLATRTDRQIFALPPFAPGATADIIRAQSAAANRRFGCSVPESIAWSPDGSMLAYACGDYELEGRGDSPPSVWLVKADGTSPRRLRTGTAAAAWPSWSPDGRRIAFSTSDAPGQSSSIYVVDLDGTHLRLIAHGVGPVWSPRGDTIAYRSSCGGVRLVTAAGKDATHGPTRGSCPRIGPRGWPVWSPDGRTITIAADGGAGFYEVSADGADLRRITSTSLLAASSAIVLPAWRPEPSRAGLLRTTNEPNL